MHIARALAQTPTEILLDEPTNHLDIHHQMQLMQLISELPVTSIVAIHDLNHASMFCDSLIVMQKGKLWRRGHLRTSYPSRCCGMFSGSKPKLRSRRSMAKSTSTLSFRGA